VFARLDDLSANSPWVAFLMQMPAANATPMLGLPALMPVDEVMDVVEAHQADEDEIDGDDIVEEPRHDQDQDAGNDSDKRRDMGSSDDHDFVLLGFARIGWGEWVGGMKAGKARQKNNA
jgi:hypothetical protein